ncbi:MAG: hypothetical protein HC888_02675 [Candidatus Competibacteraceae bacterium]|nr:hypothetical protein [Candidatus Competibacteraceae bacterium]
MDTDYQALPLVSKDRVQKRLLANAPTFSKPGLSDYVRKLGEDYLVGSERNFEKGFYEAGASAVTSSGVIPLMTDIAAKLGTDMRPDIEDNKRVVEYFKTLDAIKGAGGQGRTIGAFIGVALDSLGISYAMGPLTGAASEAVGVAARGGAAQVAKASALGIKAPIMNRTLAALGSIATESAIEAVPYFLVEEQKRARNGEPSITSQGALAVARSIGENAATDFLIGSALTGLVSAAFKTGGILFKLPNELFKLQKETDNISEIAENLVAGRIDKAVLDRLAPVDRAGVKQLLEIQSYLKNPQYESNPYGASSLLAKDLGRILEKTEKGFQIYDLNPKTGKPTLREYTAGSNMEDFLSYSYARKLEAEGISDVKKVRPENMWAYRRGNTLLAQERLISIDRIKQAAPEFFGKIKDTPRGWQSIKNRPVMTKAEVDAISRDAPAGTVVVEANIPLSGTVTEAANRGDLNIFRAKGPATVSRSDTPNAVFIGTRPATPELYKAMTEKAAELQKTLPDRSIADIRASLIMNEGFDYIELPGGTAELPASMFEFFAPRNAKLLGTLDDVLHFPKNPFSSMKTHAGVTLSGEFKAKVNIDDARFDSELMLDSGLQAIRSAADQNYDPIQQFVKTFLGRNGSPTNVVIHRSATDSTISIIKTSDGFLKVRVGRIGKSFDSEKKALETLFNALSKHVPEASRRTPTDYVKDFANHPAKWSLPDGAPKAQWLSEALNAHGGSLIVDANGFTMILGAKRFSFSSIDDAINFFAARTVGDAAVKQDLLQQGVSIVSRSGVFQARDMKTGELLKTAPTFGELRDALGYVPTKLDIRYGPKVVEVSDGAITYTMAGVTVSSSKKSALSTLGRFEDKLALQNRHYIKTGQGKTFSAEMDGTLRVHFDDWDYTETFTSIADARKFFENEVKDFVDIEKIADSKFLDFSIENGRYTLSDGKTKLYADNLDALKKHLRDYKDIRDSVPNLIELPPEVEHALPDIIKQMKGNIWINKKAGANKYNIPPTFDVPIQTKEISTWMAMRKLTSDLWSWIDDVAQRTNQPYLSEWGTRIRDLTRLANKANNDVGKYLEATFRNSKGKILPAASRRKIYYHMASAPNTPEALRLRSLYKELHGSDLADLTPDEKNVVPALRKLYKDLGTRFGIDFERLITDYMPRLRARFDALTPDQRLSMPTLGSLADETFGPAVPKEVRFWAENERTAELPEYFLKDDAFEVAQMYASQGNKKLFLNQAWRDLDDYRKATNGSIDSGIYHRLLMFKTDTLGHYTSDGER